MIKIHIISIFPEAFESYFSSSIIWRAIKNWLMDPVFYKLGDFSDKKFKHVDDNAYGMHGQVISPEPLSWALEWIFSQLWHRVPVVYLTPGWELLQQEKIENYYDTLWWEFIIICWHYEWIDQRIIDLYVTHEVSIWEYVLSSWELSAMVFIDSLVRNIPGVLWNKDSLEEDSFSKKFDRQKEYPVYTRPREFMWLEVPEVLFSGNHKKIEEWKKNNLK
mgnify:CR=1 FL=1